MVKQPGTRRRQIQAALIALFRLEITVEPTFGFREIAVIMAKTLCAKIIGNPLCADLLADFCCLLQLSADIA